MCVLRFQLGTLGFPLLHRHCVSTISQQHTKLPKGQVGRCCDAVMLGLQQKDGKMNNICHVCCLAIWHINQQISKHKMKYSKDLMGRGAKENKYFDSHQALHERLMICMARRAVAALSTYALKVRSMLMVAVTAHDMVACPVMTVPGNPPAHPCW